MSRAFAALVLLASLGPSSGARFVQENAFTKEASSEELIMEPFGGFDLVAPHTEESLDPTEREEVLSVPDKCFPDPWAAKRKAGDADEEDVNDDGRNGSALLDLDLDDRFKNFKCNRQEYSDFLSMYGLAGKEKDEINAANFSYKTVCEKNNVIWIYPAEDPNGAFSINTNVCHRLTLWSGTACSVQVRRVSSVKDGVAFLNSLPPDSARHVVLGGHGTGQALAWGSGMHRVGVETDKEGIPLGRIVKFTKDFKTISKVKKPVPSGSIGYVGKVDNAKDVMVFFDGDLGTQWVRTRDFAGHQVVGSPMTDLLDPLSRVLQRHGSIFMDSCLSATDQLKPNLAEYVAQKVGKGARVFGSILSFNKVDVQRTEAWHADIKMSEEFVQRIYVNGQARCPLWAGNVWPGAEGNCQCKTDFKCATKAGKSCPSAKGQTSDVDFLPYCAEPWAEDQCQCQKGK
mmetsp:Transcript_96504/g.288046  ORF Transcript_96504/g.288046 Transcript_96504/m.288046 type:complete len:457 (-) Transcript_96504:58-1428(-)|eukprot:CAMPEP_0175193626 /NCGR_PEP_ID=MMETSP0093-20121207/6072_1 /TAXON_ID=311494 /ORGANISM="Alexandrium monilatum, Strain CCMP3105" /LENGTH=456 /DNA_ID=CAMNT_0016486521 /DNA_START=43 /DNA_END=1413 /DNA_ORIENTATION=+